MGDAPTALAIDLITPRNYAAIPPGSPLFLSITGGTASSVRYSVDGGTLTFITAPYLIDTSAWTSGTHIVRVYASDAAGGASSRTFTIFVDPSSTWPPDTARMDIVLIGFGVNASAMADSIISQYFAPTPLTPNPSSFYDFELHFPFTIREAAASYQQTLLDAVRGNATFTNTQGRLNLTALIAQRSDGIPRDIFNSLVGYQIGSEWFDDYLTAHPPVPPSANPGFTFYLVNLSALDNPANGTEHWFVRRTPDPDTGVDENWWRLEWDNGLNTPMAYPMDIFGGPNRTVVVDPTAYEWYTDWAYIWRENGSGPAPYSTRYPDVPPANRAVYLGELVNDLVAGLGTVLPWSPPTESTIVLHTYVLSASPTYPIDNLTWVYHERELQAYLQSFLPFKVWRTNTTFAALDDYPALKAVVDSNTTYVGGQGEVNGTNVWQYLYGNRSLYTTPAPDVLNVLSVCLIFDNRTMFFGGAPFSGLGGSGITTIVMRSDRLFYPNGTREKGLTSLLGHELGHTLGYDHQFGPHYRADFVDGNMGYFRNELTYGTFWEDAMYRVIDTGLLYAVLSRLATRDPVNLAPEFERFYGEYTSLDLLAAHDTAARIEAMLDDTVPPVANAGPDRTVEHGVPLLLDGSGSSDNYRVVNYSWDFGDGTSAWSWDPTIEHAWTFGGSYTLTLTVFDAAGNRATDSAVVTVSGPSAPAPSANWGLVAGVGIVAAGGVGVLLYVVLRRKRARPPSSGSR